MKGKNNSLKRQIAFLIIAVMILISIIGCLKTVNAWSAKVVQNPDITISRNDNGQYMENYFSIKVDQDGFTGYCIDGGGHLAINYTRYSGILDMYDIPASLRFPSGDNWRSAMWLVDNGFISESRTEYDQIQNAALKNQTKQNMKELLNGSGYTEAASAIDRLSDTQLIAAENCVLWQLCYNKKPVYGYATIGNSNDGKALVSALKELAVAHKTYTHVTSNVSIKTENFSINKDTRKVGNFKATGITNVTANDLIVEVNGNTVNGAVVNNVATTSDSVTFALTLPQGVLKTAAGSVNTVTVYCKKAIGTEAYVLTNNGYDQYLLAVRKSFTSASDHGSDTVNIMDLALVKSIVAVKYPDEEEKTIERFDPISSVDTSALKRGANYAGYNIKKHPLEVINGSTITYRLYVYNEGNVKACAKKIVDYIPTGMDVVAIGDITNPLSQGLYTKDDKIYKDDSGNEYYKVVIDSSKFMSPLDGYNAQTDKISYNYIDVKLKVNKSISSTQSIILRNFAEIQAVDKDGFKDIDSTPGNLNGELCVNGLGSDDFNTKVERIEDDNNLTKIDYQKGSKYNYEDDDDFEQITLTNPTIDLALRKFISSVISSNGNTESYDTTREPKLFGRDIVDTMTATLQLRRYAEGETTMDYVHRKDTISVSRGDKITYKIRVYNEGLGYDYNGLATEIIDTLPAGVKILEQDTKTANETAGNNWMDWTSSTLIGTRIAVAALPSTTQNNLASKGILNTLRYNAEYQFDKTIKNYQELIVVCQVEDTAELNTKLINTASIGAYRYFKNNTAVDITDETIVPSGTMLDRDSTVYESNLTSLELAKLNVILNDYEYSDIFYLIHFWLEFGKNKLNDHVMIKAVAEKLLENYTPQYQQYVRGLQDDDDFESIIVKESKTSIRLKKVDKNGKPLEGIKFNVKIDNGNITTGYTNGFGYVNVLPSDTIVGASEFDYAVVHKAVITEIADTRIPYIPVANPVELYYAFDGEGNIAYTLDGVTDYTTVHDETAWNEFIGATGATITKECDLADGTTGNIEIIPYNKAVVVKVENAEIEGSYKFNLFKVENNTEKTPIKDASFGINGVMVNTDANGKYAYTDVLENVGWNEIKISELQLPDSDYIMLNNPITVYVYTDIVNYKYQITKVGFSRTDYIDITGSIGNTIQTKTMNVSVRDGSEVTLTLAVNPQEIVNGVVNINLTIPNPKAVQGQYSLKIKKVDLSGSPIKDVGFTIKYNETALDLTSKTDADGLLTIGTQSINKDNVNIVDKYEISEIKIDNDCITLADSVEVWVYKYKNGGNYKILHACFGQDGVKKTVKLEDGTDVELNIEYSMETGEILVTIPNKRVKFDLALVKWVSEAIIVEDGVEKTTPGNKLEDLQNQYDHRLIYAMHPDTIGNYTDLEPVIKVDIPKSKINDTVIKFKYQIRVYNEGDIDGYVKEITDYIPRGMKFVQEDNPLWKDAGEGKVTTDQLKDTVLPTGGDPQTVEIVYTWVNSEDNLGLIVNMAEISKDYNDKGLKDIDSTPDNQIEGEDDIDDAAVLLSVRTGESFNKSYIVLAASVVVLIATGAVLIKKLVL